MKRREKRRLQLSLLNVHKRSVFRTRASDVRCRVWSPSSASEQEQFTRFNRFAITVLKPDSLVTVNQCLLQSGASFFGKCATCLAFDDLLFLQITPDDDFVLDHHPSYSNIVIGAGFSGTAQNESNYIKPMWSPQLLAGSVRPYFNLWQHAGV